MNLEYVGEDSCKIGYTGDWWSDNDDHENPFEKLIARNSDDSEYYHCRRVEYIDNHWNLHETSYLIWYADRKWDHGKTIVFSGHPFVEFTVPLK